MTQTQTPNRLHTQMAEVVALEAAIEQVLDQLSMECAHHPEVTAMLRDFHAMTKGQLYALDTRLQTLTDNVSSPDRTATIRPDGESGDGNTYPVSTALQTAYTLFNRALIAYATLQVLAIRFRDSWVIAADGTTAHLARQHTQNYVHAMQQVARMLHDVVVWELDQEGLECQCVCPSCSSGSCLCAAASRVTLSHAWIDDGPIAVDAGVYVQLPRKGSAAAYTVEQKHVCAVRQTTATLLGPFCLQNLPTGGVTHGVNTLCVYPRSRLCLDRSGVGESCLEC